MNIHSNVNKDNSKTLLFIGISIALMIAAFAYYNTTPVSISEPMQTSGMSEADRIKQLIREKELIRDAKTQKALEEMRAGNQGVADATAEEIGELNQVIEKLYDDLHEANLKEGENGETK